MKRYVGQCPECLTWHPVSWDATIPPGGLWWAETNGVAHGSCPSCDHVVLVESECELFGEADIMAALIATTLGLLGLDGGRWRRPIRTMRLEAALRDVDLIRRFYGDHLADLVYAGVSWSDQVAHGDLERLRELTKVGHA